MTCADEAGWLVIIGLILHYTIQYWLVVTGTMEFYDFPFSWECHHPN